MDKLEAMRHAGKINQYAIEYGFQVAKPGKTLKDVDEAVEWYVMYGGRDRSCKPAFKNYQPNGAAYPFPATSCISPNDVVVHGIPGDYVIQPGDLITIDVGSEYHGWFVDSARSKIIAGKENPAGQYLVDATEKILEAQLSVIKDGCSLMEIVIAAESEAARLNVTILPQFGGHQIGEKVHMDPFIPNAIDRNISRIRQQLDINRYSNTRLQDGQTICIEPVVTYGSIDIIVDEDKWTVRKEDKALTAHTERCILVTKNGCEILS